MVLAERGSDKLRNGGRSRGTSPNGHASESSSEEEREEKIRVGRDYQCQIPAYIPLSERKPEEQCFERALLVWSPASGTISDQKLDDYITLAKEKYGYNGEQALGMLYWHKHDLEKAILDLANFTPFPDDWTVEDKVLFEQAFQFHGKSFHRIRQMLPDKTIANLVKYYYSWKKTRSRTSLMDRQARKMAAMREEGGSEVGSELGSNTDSDSEDKVGGKWTIHRGIRRNSRSPPPRSGNNDSEGEGGTRSSCNNCEISCSMFHSTPKGSLCTTCYSYYKRTGGLRPTTGPIRREGRPIPHNILRNKRKPPRGMYINHDDLVGMATGPAGQGENMLKAMDREIVSLKRLVQNNKQNISSLKRHTTDGISDVRPPESNTRINSRWANDELLLAVQGIRKYGKDFKAIAEVIGNKTEAHVRSYFINYRRRYNLDAVLKEFEAENGPIVEEERDEKMEVDGVSSGSEAGTPAPPSPVPPTSKTLKNPNTLATVPPAK
ncbi:REST corepressor 1 isoform X2 [Neocloeon triangulifer]|uniref:REST corepressor 1 isoform X2 n=1 Tax=Neocloeon triangulifer TaxID=2078957 RepID=UPI00286EB752|nr:REST corepressor 1 isoform X2 [Neocloeon triangulifer]